MVTKELVEKVERCLASLRPYLENDGGDITLEEISDDMVVSVRLHGACNSCPFSGMTMQAGVEQTILRDIPEIKKVIAIED